MLTNLLPGLRELRAPLAAGYLWIATGWIVLLNGKPTINLNASKLGRAVQSISHEAGRPATIAAITFLAYLIGTVSDAVVQSVVNRVTQTGMRKWPYRDTLYNFAENQVGHMEPSAGGVYNERDGFTLIPGVMTWEGQPELIELSPSITRGIRKEISKIANPIDPQEAVKGEWVKVLYMEIAQSGGLANDSGDWNFDTDDPDGETFKMLDQLTEYTANQLIYIEIVNRLFADIPYASSRLIGLEPDLYSLIDRLNAESEFRLSVCLPLVLLGISAAAVFGWWLISLLPAAMAMALLGLSKKKTALQVTAQAIYAGRIPTPVLKQRGADGQS